MLGYITNEGHKITLSNEIPIPSNITDSYNNIYITPNYAFLYGYIDRYGLGADYGKRIQIKSMHNSLNDKPSDELLAEFAQYAYNQGFLPDAFRGWNVKRIDDENTRFSCTIFTSTNSIVYAFRGTPRPSELTTALIDWGQTLNYYMLADVNTAAHAQKDSLVRVTNAEIIPSFMNEDKNIYLTGHSLGGWLALNSYIQISDALSVNSLYRLKSIVTFNTIGISNADMQLVARATDKNTHTNITDYYFCCDIARWYGYNAGYNFPGQHKVINEYHDEVGLAEGDYQSLYKHAYNDNVSEALDGLKKISRLLSKSKLEAAWYWFYYTLYTKPTGILPFDMLIPYPPEVVHSATILNVRVDAHGMSHFLDKRQNDSEHKNRSLMKNLYYAHDSDGLPYPEVTISVSLKTQQEPIHFESDIYNVVYGLVNKDKVNLHPKISTEGKAIGFVMKGDVVEILDTISDDGEIWYRIRVQKVVIGNDYVRGEYEGYIMTNYVDK
ncbi:hypothetical protein AGMMS49992_32160 [Clostridia bacterium]|nr:hypothetical protein AGMMS49992_32160 [Clostridia bacterium]